MNSLSVLKFHFLLCCLSFHFMKISLNKLNTVDNTFPKIFNISINPNFNEYNINKKFLIDANTLTQVIIFGNALDKIMRIGFMHTKNCDDSKKIVNIIKTEKYIIVKEPFLRQNSTYKICYAFATYSNKLKIQNYFLNNDSLTFINTNEISNSTYYFSFEYQIIIISFLLLMSGLLSGLAIGFMTLSLQELVLVSKSGTLQERLNAKTILPLRKLSSSLLCSFIVSNVIVNAAISILLNNLMTGYIALLCSSILIVIIGEIIPQVICVKKGLEICAKTIWLTKFIVFITCPIAYPIGKFLDSLLGKECISFNRKRMIELIKMTTCDSKCSKQDCDSKCSKQELKIAEGAIRMSDKVVSNIMTKIDNVFMLPETTILDAKTVAEILKMGYTRIPIYSGDRNNVVSLLFIKDLTLLDPNDNFTVKMVCNYHSHQLRFASKETPLSILLEEFKKGNYHLAFVTNAKYEKIKNMEQNQNKKTSDKLVGIVTLEDIIEEILQEEIYDESDIVFGDNKFKTKRRRNNLFDLEIFNYQAAVASECLVSIQIQLVAIQWLVSNHNAFKDIYIQKPILKRLINQNVHKVEITQLLKETNSNVVYPKSAKLYTKNEPSNRFILILEGRVFVTIGEIEMTFEAGPWYCFGKEILDCLYTSIIKKKLSDNKSVEKNIGCGISFTPEYSAVICDSCTYLEISAKTYILAYKSTLITKNK